MQLFNHSHQVLKPLNQVIALVDPDANNLTENQNLNSDDQNHFYSIEEFEVRIMEPEKSGGPWQTKATIPMQSSENALTVRMVTLMVNFHPLVFKASWMLNMVMQIMLWNTACNYWFLFVKYILIVEYIVKRKRNTFSHWYCLRARRGCRCKRAYTLVHFGEKYW